MNDKVPPRKISNDTSPPVPVKHCRTCNNSGTVTVKSIHQRPMGQAPCPVCRGRRD